MNEIQLKLAANEQLLAAVKAGNLDQVKESIEKGVNINARDERGKTALHIAAFYGHLEIVEYLVGKIDIDARDNDGMVALHYAILYNIYDPFKNNHLKIFKYLVEKGADIKAVDNSGWAALHRAALHARLDILQFLVGEGVDINVVGDDKQTALHIVVLRGPLEIVKYLLEQGGNIHLPDNKGNSVWKKAINDWETMDESYRKVLIKHAVLQDHTTQKPDLIINDNDLSKYWNNQVKKEIFLLNNKSIFDSMSKYYNYVINRDESLDSLVSDAENFLKWAQKKIQEKFSVKIYFNGIIEYRVDKRYPASLKALALGNVPFECYEELSSGRLSDPSTEQPKVGPVIN